MTRDARPRPGGTRPPRPALGPAGRAAVLAASALASGCMGLGGPQIETPRPVSSLASVPAAAAAAPRPADEPRAAPRPGGLPPSGADATAEELAGDGTWAARGARLLSADRPGAAVAAFRRSLAEEGVTPSALVGLGAAHRAQGLTGEARRILARAARTWPDFPAVRNSHGAVLYDLGLHDAAESEFRAAAELMARQGRAPSPEILRNLALAARASAPEGAGAEARVGPPPRPATAAPPLS